MKIDKTEGDSEKLPLSGRLVRLKEAARILPISYSTLYRLGREQGPFQKCFFLLGSGLFLDLDEFVAVGREENRKRGLER